MKTGMLPYKRRLIEKSFKASAGEGGRWLFIAIPARKQRGTPLGRVPC